MNSYNTATPLLYLIFCIADCVGTFLFPLGCGTERSFYISITTWTWLHRIFALYFILSLLEDKITFGNISIQQRLKFYKCLYDLTPYRQ